MNIKKLLIQLMRKISRTGAYTYITATISTVASGDWVNTGAKITLNPGIYMFIERSTFGTNSSGIRAIRVVNQATGEAINGSQIQQGSISVSGFGAMLEATTCIRVNTTATYELQIRQTSGTSLSCTPTLKIIQLD